MRRYKMSNRIYLEAREVKILRTGDTWQELHLSDDYSSYSIDKMNTPRDTFSIPDDDFDKLKLFIEAQEEGGCEELDGLLGYMIIDEKGITIEDNYYEWKEIKHLFE